MKKMFLLMLLPMAMCVVSCDSDDDPLENGGGSSSDNSGGASKIEAVDLGLSVKWATCNVGATKPEEYGDYFAWGETEPYYAAGHSQDDPCKDWKDDKNGYSWKSYKYCNGTYESQTKYCLSSYFGTVDDKSVLESTDDVATVNWGGSWRMPTWEEMKELRDNCTWTWTTRKGVKGYNVVGPNGNSIFLPAAGYRGDVSLYEDGYCGYYWASSLYSSLSYFASTLSFVSNNLDVRHSGYRYIGATIRPVCK